jgi:uncharacterized iron-regulated membrane protein
MKKNFIFYIHSVAGLVSGIFILLMSISGAALVFHEDVDQFRAPAVANFSNNAYSADRSYAALQQLYPKAQISNCTLPYGLAQAVRFTIYDSSYKNGMAPLQIFLDPQNLTILKAEGSNDNFMSWLSKFHNSFHLGKTGEWLLGGFALVFLLSIITGFIQFRKKIVAVLLFRRSAYKKNNLHQIVGVWALVFNLIIAVTGFWMQRYVFKKEFYQSYNYTPVLKASPPLSFKFDSAYAAIKKTYPDFTAAVIYFAQSNSGKTAVYGSRASNAYIHSKKFADAIMLDSVGGIAKTRMINENSSTDKYDIINSQLHMGRFGGTGIKIIYFVFGLSGGLLSITGFLLWWRRRKNKNSPVSR